jgi:hypothetical protein
MSKIEAATTTASRYFISAGDGQPRWASALTTSDGGNAMVGSMTPPMRRIRDARAIPARGVYEVQANVSAGGEWTSRRRLSTDVTVMASIATAATEIVQWPLLVAADRAIHLLERLRRHPDAATRGVGKPGHDRPDVTAAVPTPVEVGRRALRSR